MTLARLESLLDSVLNPPSRPLDPRLHGYQRRAVEHLWNHGRAALFLDMGLG